MQQAAARMSIPLCAEAIAEVLDLLIVPLLYRPQFVCVLQPSNWLGRDKTAVRATLGSAFPALALSIREAGFLVLNHT